MEFPCANFWLAIWVRISARSLLTGAHHYQHTEAPAKVTFSRQKIGFNNPLRWSRTNGRRSENSLAAEGERKEGGRQGTASSWMKKLLWGQARVLPFSRAASTSAQVLRKNVWSAQHLGDTFKLTECRTHFSCHPSASLLSYPQHHIISCFSLCFSK